MAITLPRNALIKFTNLNTYAQRNLNEITGFAASGGVITFYTPATTGLSNGSTVVISNMPGAPSATWSFVVSNVTATSFTTPGSTYLTWPIGTLRCYGTGVPTVNMFYLDAILSGTTTLKPGDTVALEAGASFPATDMVAAITTNNEVIFKSGTVFSGGASYPLYTASGAPNDVAPSGNKLLKLKTTAATRSPGLTSVYWAKGGGASSVTLSDHLRSGFDISPESIEVKQRTANGTMRKSHIASKSAFSVSWDLLPADAVATVDGYAGGNELKEVFNNNVNPFTMELYNRDSARKGSSPDSVYNIYLDDFKYTIEKRNVYSPDGRLTDYWNVQLTLVEV